MQQFRFVLQDLAQINLTISITSQSVTAMMVAARFSPGGNDISPNNRLSRSTATLTDSRFVRPPRWLDRATERHRVPSRPCSMSSFRHDRSVPACSCQQNIELRLAKALDKEVAAV